MSTDFTERPWGGFQVLEANEHFWVKRLLVQPGHRLSLQRHLHRDEIWIVESGGGFALVNDQAWAIGPDAVIEVPRLCWHRVASRGEPLLITEFAFGAPDEGDVERREDDYGRA